MEKQPSGGNAMSASGSPEEASPSYALASRGEVIGLLKKHGLYLKKSLGQNFLVDPRALERILEAIDPQPEDGILEIGPGIGTMTHALARRAGAVSAVEYDPRFLPILEEMLPPENPVRIVHGDVLKVDLRQILLDMGDRPLKAAANLPYYITSPALTRLLEQHDLLERIVVLVQKEVGQRLGAKPGTGDYGSLSVFAQYYADVQVTSIVPNSAFLPPPKVQSAVVRLMIHREPPVRVEDETLFFRIVKAAFGQRRKTLLNALSAGLHLPKDTVQAAMNEAELDAQLRGETLGLEEFARLTQALIRTEAMREPEEES